MLNSLSEYVRRKIRPSEKIYEIDPDEIFIDSRNLPNFDTSQFEGRLERPISKRVLIVSAFIFSLILISMLGQAWKLQIKEGEAYTIMSERNSLRQAIITAPRGNIYDRNGVLLASNKADQSHPEYPSRDYKKIRGLGNLIGYINYPKKDSSGNYYETEISGKDGVEAFFNDYLSGQNGLKIAETDALGNIQSESILTPPAYGNTLRLAIDSELQSEIYDLIQNLADSVGFSGGSVVIMDVNSGEILSIVSYPEYDSSVMSEGKNAEEIKKFVNDPRQPFLDRATSGLYTPGSIVKPFLAIGALEQKIIDPSTKILSTGSISVPNSYDPTKKSVFTDWKPHGWVDMIDAIAVSSDVYFYEIGGGYEEQIGLGIANIEKYMRLFGFGSAETGSLLLPKAGTIPNPEWKKINFEGDAWRVGDTYNSSIGQYGFQVTPVQVARAISAIANGGRLLEPTIVMSDNLNAIKFRDLGLKIENINVSKKGMRQAVLAGTAKNLDIPQVEIAAKTGTAELGTKKKFVNSWVTGYFPYDNPRFAFAAIMEKGPSENTIGALYVIRQMFEWMSVYTPQYLE